MKLELYRTLPLDLRNLCFLTVCRVSALIRSCVLARGLSEVTRLRGRLPPAS